ncbi:MAG: AEC family transporter [Ruminococcaceae bacterium]|nr:AEC family transporter [Oscillospiraceae bacterium]
MTFLNNLQTVAIQVLILYLIAGVGFAADKTKIFVQADGKRLVDLLFNIILPIAVINSFLSMERTNEHIKGLGLAFLLAFMTHLLGVGVSSLTFRKRPKAESGIYHYAITFSNAAFLALPLAESVVGKEGIFYSSCYVAVFNVFAFTYGIREISGGKAKINVKNLILNPGSISVIIGIPLFLAGVTLPDFLQDAMSRVAACNSPMAMIVFGTFFANCNFKNIFAKKEIYFVSLLRLILIPLAMTLIFKLIGVEGSMRTALTISASAPIATNTAMYSAKYDNDTALSSELVGQTSVLSVITMPVIVALATVI